MRERRFLHQGSSIAIAAAVALAPQLAQAQSLTYTIGQKVGSGNVTGSLTTDGKIGPLSTDNVKSWSVTLNGNGASATISSAQGAVQIKGNDVIATAKDISFDYGGKDGSYLLFQQSLYSGSTYWCNSNGPSACLTGATVAPAYYTDSTATFAKDLTGLQVIATIEGTPSADPGPAPGPGPGPDPFADTMSVIDSVGELGRTRIAQMVTSRYQNQLLLGLNEQANCGSCAGGGIVIGSLSATTHGRLRVGENWTVFGGLRAGRSEVKGADSALDTGLAFAMHYDPVFLGSSRPFAALSVSASYQKVAYRRQYTLANANYTGEGKTNTIGASVEAIAGWTDRLGPRDELAASVGYSRQWQLTRSYAENGIADGNLLAASLPGRTGVLNTASAGAQATHLFSRWLEATLDGAINWSFNADSGVRANIGGLTIITSQPDFFYGQIGGRVGIRILRGLTIDLFANHLIAPRTVGSSTHGGVGIRLNL